MRDTGIGIREDLQPRLFQWFSQVGPAATPQAGGTGLGLAISDRLSRVLGGSITVESRVGTGSTFTFVFRGMAAPPDEGPDPAPFDGARVAAMVEPGIVGDQLLSLLRGWKVELVPCDAASGPVGDVDAIVVDAEASAGALRAALLRNRPAWRLGHVPLLTIASLRSSGELAIAPHESVLTTPVRLQALHDALRSAIAPAVPAGDGIAAPQRCLAPLSVLVVEDNEPNRRVIRLMLNELGLSSDEAAGGHDAIDAAARRSYDVILMDLQMPDLDGLEATRRIRARESGHRARIVALTANVLESDETRCRAAGMNGYLQKPLTLDALSAALRSVPFMS